jgi:hypothetical protein
MNGDRFFIYRINNVKQSLVNEETRYIQTTKV